MNSRADVSDSPSIMSVIRRVMVSRRPAPPRPAPDRKVCNYMHRVCFQARVEGYEYCIRHILEDKTAPFRQCAFTHAQSGRRCSNGAPKTDKRESLCQWHVKKALLHRRNASRKQTFVETPQKILESLEHHCHDPQHSTEQSETARNTIKFYDVDSDHETPTINDTWQGGGGGADSDAGSVDNEMEDPLRHAGVYTAEEASTITRDKLIRLQSLYLEQFKRLNHVLREKRRDYLRRRRETKDGGVSKDFKSPHEEALYKRYRAYYRYHRAYGVEAVLKHRFRERQKAVAEGGLFPVPPLTKESCVYSSRGLKCGQKVLPLSKFCLAHILHDKNQLLFEKCGGSDCDSDCTSPLLVVQGARDGCLLHTAVTPLQSVLPTFSTKDDVDVEGGVDMEISDIEHFQSMDDIAALGLDVVQPGSLFGLNQFGDPGESTDSALSDDDGMMGMGNASDLLGDVDVGK